ncbi:MAG: tetratricopeptide repeat protein [Phycisphaerales bacterium]|nr:tetratricopeptide repeat protein [Phycisphaerales bacterium]
MADRIEQLRRMLDTEPNDAFCLYALGQEYAREGQFEAAQAHLGQSIEADPDQPYAHYHRAKCLMQLGRIDESRQVIDEGLALSERLGDMQAAGELAELRQTAQHDD